MLMLFCKRKTPLWLLLETRRKASTPPIPANVPAAAPAANPAQKSWFLMSTPFWCIVRLEQSGKTEVARKRLLALSFCVRGNENGCRTQSVATKKSWFVGKFVNEKQNYSKTRGDIQRAECAFAP